MRCFMEQLLPHRGAELTLLGSKDERNVLRCGECGLVMCSTGGRERYLKLYKEAARYFDLVGAGYADFEERFWHDYAISEVRFRNLAKQDGSAKTLLDVGTGNGAFLQRCQQARLRCCGVDLNEWMLDRARKLVPEVVFRCGEITELEFATRFDVITFIDVFEHVLDPLAYVKRVRELLSDSGLVVVETPDLASDGWKERGLQWIHCKPQEHPFLYCEKHICAIFGSVGLVLVDKVFTIPGRCTYYLRHKA